MSEQENQDDRNAANQKAASAANTSGRDAPSGEGQRPTPKAPSGMSDADRKELEERMASQAMPEDPRPLYVYISPKFENGKFLILRGSMEGLTNELKRQDIWATFRGGICESREPLVGDWLQAHSTNDAVEHAKYHDDLEQYDLLRPDSCSNFNFCKSADDDHIGAWADIEYRKLQKINEERSLPADYDFEKLLAGENPTQQVGPAGAPVVRTR